MIGGRTTLPTGGTKYTPSWALDRTPGRYVPAINHTAPKRKESANAARF